MEGAILIAPDEDNRDEVKRAAQVALGPKAGAAIRPWAVVDRDLGDVPSLLRGEHRYEPVQLAVDFQ